MTETDVLCWILYDMLPRELKDELMICPSSDDEMFIELVYRKFRLHGVEAAREMIVKHQYDYIDDMRLPPIPLNAARRRRTGA